MNHEYRPDHKYGNHTVPGYKCTNCGSIYYYPGRCPRCGDKTFKGEEPVVIS